MEAKELARSSLKLGLISWGLLIINILILIAIVTSLDQSAYIPFLVFLFLLLITLMFNLAGLIVGIVALIKNIRKGNDHALIRTAILGVLMNIMSTVAGGFVLFAL